MASTVWNFVHFRYWLFLYALHCSLYRLILFCLTIVYTTICTLLYWLQLTPSQHLTDIHFLHPTVISIEYCPCHISLLWFNILTSVFQVFILHFGVVNWRVLNLILSCRSYVVPENFFYHTVLYNMRSKFSPGLVQVMMLGFP